jgi:hypothetical protein
LLARYFMYTILSVSRNTGLLLQRNDALAIAGFRVISPREPEEAPYLATQQRVHAVVIGHSVEAPSRAVLIEALRRVCPVCPLIFVYTYPQTEGEPLADASLDVTRGTGPLIEILIDRLGREEAAA